MSPSSSREDERVHGAPSGGQRPHDPHAEDFRRRLWIALALAISVVAFSPMIRDWLGLAEVTGFEEAVAPVFGTILFFYGGRPFLAGAVSELRARQPGM